MLPPHLPPLGSAPHHTRRALHRCSDVTQPPPLLIILAGGIWYTTRQRSVSPWRRMGRVGFDSRIFFPWMAGRRRVVSPYVRGPFPSQEIRRIPERDDPGPPVVPGRAVDRFGIPNPRKSGSVIGADRQRFGPSCVLLKRVPQGRTESGGIVLAANAGPRVPSGGVTLKRRCTYRPSVIYLIVNKLLSLSLSLYLSLSLSQSAECVLSHPYPHFFTKLASSACTGD